MSAEFEDPRKKALRERCAAAVDAAGYTVDAGRPPISFPDEASYQGAIRGDVVSTDSGGKRHIYFVRVDGERPLPQWLVNIVTASFSLVDTEIYVVTEHPSDSLRATCATAGAGLLELRGEETLERVSDYGPPDETEERKRFNRKLKELRRKLDTKLRLNMANLEQSFQESYAVTADMAAATRDQYLDSIETIMVGWREWGDELSTRLDGLAATGEIAELELIEQEITKGPTG